MEIFRYSHGHKAASNKVSADPLSHCNMDSNQGRIRIICKREFPDLIILR